MVFANRALFLYLISGRRESLLYVCMHIYALLTFMYIVAALLGSFVRVFCYFTVARTLESSALFYC
jgi:hypothetical protein